MNSSPPPPVCHGTHPSKNFPEAVKVFTALYHEMNQIQHALRTLRETKPSPLERSPEERSLLRQVEEILQKKKFLEEQFGPQGLIPTPEIQDQRIASLVFGAPTAPRSNRTTSSSSALYQVPIPKLPSIPDDLPKIDP